MAELEYCPHCNEKTTKLFMRQLVLTFCVVGAVDLVVVFCAEKKGTLLRNCFFHNYNERVHVHFTVNNNNKKSNIPTILERGVNIF